MYSERACTEGHINDLHDSLRNVQHICVRRRCQLKSFHDLICQASSRSGLIVFQPRLVFRRSRVGEMIRTRGERTGNNNRGFDVPPCQFTRVAHRDSIHTCFRCEVRCEIWGRTAPSTATPDPDNQTASLFAKDRKCRPVHPLSAENIYVIKLSKLSWSECFHWPEDHVTGVVDDYVEASGCAKNLLYCSISGLLRTDVQFCCPKINIVLGGKLPGGFDLFGIPPDSLT